jgi:outer membrane receptor protein involved in Fe transport
MIKSTCPSTALRPTLLVLALATAWGSGASWAQESAAAPAQSPAPVTAPTSASTDKLDTVVITTRKRSEASQTVPVAVSAFGTQALERMKISGTQDLQFSIPNAVLTGNDRFTIRGIGNNSLGGDNGVGIAFNGASIGPNPYDELYDLDRVEVLRGPQGTLFGRNTTGGALALFSKRPTSNFEGQITTEVGTYGRLRFGGVLNVPVTENIRQRFAGYSLSQEGFTRNEFTGNSVDGREQYSLRGSTSIDLGDRTNLLLVYGGYREDSSRTREAKRLCKTDAVLGCSATELGFDSPAFSATLFRTLYGPLTATGFTPAGGDLFAGAPNPKDLRTVAADYDASFRTENSYGTAEMSHDLGWGTLTWIGAYSASHSEQSTDWDNAALPFRFTRPITYSMARDRVVTTDQVFTTDSALAYGRTYTNELRLASNSGGRFSYTTGLFQMDSKGGGGFFIWHPFFELIQKLQNRPPETWFVNGETRNARTQAWAWFGEGQLRIGESLRGTLGARYTKEDRSSEGRNIILTANQPFTAAPPIHDGHWTGRASLDWVPAKDVLVYGSWATGYKGGGFNAANAAQRTFKPETVTALEFGAKAEFFDRSLRTNISLFNNDYKNMQLAQRISASAITSNADARTRGIELETAWAPTRAWLLDANVSFLRTRIGDFMTIDSANPAQSATSTSPAVQVNLAGKQLPHAPRSKFKVGVQHSFAGPGGWKATARLDHVWQDDYFAREFNTINDRIAAWSVTNLQVGLASPTGNVGIKVFVKNLANNENITNIIIEDPTVGRYRNVRLMDPRTVGLQVQLNF